VTQAYLFAANLFALTALLLGLNNFSRGALSRRLAPLFLLTAVRAGIIILSQLQLEAVSLWPVALEVFSTFCLVWALTNPVAELSLPWLAATRLGSGGAILLSLLPLFKEWPAPAALHSLVIAIFSVPFILVSHQRRGWLHLATPLTLGLGYFFMLPGLGGGAFAWLLVLLAYALLIATLHWEGVQLAQQQQAASELAARTARNQSEERQRLLEVSDVVSAAPGIEDSMAHIARSLAHVTGADQAAVAVLGVTRPEQFRLAAIYSPERPVAFNGRTESLFVLDDFTLLAQVVEENQQLLAMPVTHGPRLAALYGLWFEDRLGPLLLQPLTVQGTPVAVLLLANPVTHRDFRGEDRRLVRALATQIGAMTDSYRRYDTMRRQIAEAVPAETRPYEALPIALDEAATDLAVATEPALSRRAANPSGLMAALNSDPHHQQPILEAVQEGIVVSDVSGRVVLVNRAAEQILGKRRHELLGQPIHTVYGEIDSGEAIEDLATAFSRRDEPLPTFLQKEGRVIQGQLVPWRNDDHEWTGIIAVFRDVTHRVKADQARSDFIATLSRELRVPLTTIKGYSELIIRSDMENYTPEQLYIQRVMHSSADRMVAVLDNAVQLGTTSPHELLPNLTDVVVAEVIEYVVQDIATLAHLNELTLTTEIKSNLPLLVADRQQVYRIFMNLLENACHFTPPGGRVIVRAWPEQSRQGRQFAPEVVVAVSDNGVGIPKNEQHRIFEPFYQIPGVLGTGGMGMGLAVVREMVEVHKGRVWVESTVHEGSTFYVALPARPG
jgi:PAS domain S-box-containing protein